MRIDVDAPHYRPMLGVKCYLDDADVTRTAKACDTDEGWVKLVDESKPWRDDVETIIRYGVVRLEQVV